MNTFKDFDAFLLSKTAPFVCMPTSADEYLTAQQITNFFSREAKRRKGVKDSDDEHGGVQEEINITGMCNRSKRSSYLPPSNI